MIAWWEQQDSEKLGKDSGNPESRPCEPTTKASTGPAMSPSRLAELELEEIAEDAGTRPEKIKDILAQSEGWGTT